MRARGGDDGLTRLISCGLFIGVGDGLRRTEGRRRKNLRVLYDGGVKSNGAKKEGHSPSNRTRTFQPPPTTHLLPPTTP